MALTLNNGNTNNKASKFKARKESASWMYEDGALATGDVGASSNGQNLIKEQLNQVPSVSSRPNTSWCYHEHSNLIHLQSLLGCD